MMYRRLVGALVVLAVAAVPGLTGAQAPPAGKPTDLAVTVAYTGKGAVDATHEILVFLFPDANVTADSRPLAVQAITKSGGTATFTGVTQDPVFIVTAYDEKANYDGNSPPPPGTPIGRHSKDGKMVPVKPSATPKVKMSFDDSNRWK